MTRQWWIGVVALAMASQVHGAAFDDLGFGSRPQAMGGAFVALADDANAIYWNPAGLPNLERQQAMFMHGLYGDVEGLSFDFLSYVYPMKYSAMGIGWSRVGTTLEQGDEVSLLETTFSESTYMLSWGVNPAVFGKDQLQVGLTFKRLVLDSSLEQGSGVGFDLGVQFKPFEWLQAGFVARNVATDVKNEQFPSTYRLGLASRLWENKIRLVADLSTGRDVEQTDGLSLHPHFGAELFLFNVAALRGGWDDGSPTGGVGFRLRSLQVDYSVVSQEVMGLAHRVALGVEFGPGGTGHVETASLGSKDIEPPKEIKTGYVQGRVVVFWGKSPSKRVIGYNLYMLNRAGKWIKINKDLVTSGEDGIGVEAKRGDKFTFGVTAVNVDGEESARSNPAKVVAR